MIAPPAPAVHQTETARPAPAPGVHHTEPVRVKPSRSTYFIWVPVALIALGLGAWALLAGLPFGGDDEPQRPATREMEVVDERQVATGTLSQINEAEGVTQPATATDVIQTTTTPIPPNTQQPVPIGIPPAGVQTPAPIQQPSRVITGQQPRPVPVPPAPQPRVVPTPAPARPQPVQVQPAPQPRPSPPPVSAARGEISESEAVSVLRNYILSRRDYGVRSECIAIGSLGYRNVGYTLDAFDRCEGKGLGRWRVDSKNRDVFRQRADGRFLRP